MGKSPKLNKKTMFTAMVLSNAAVSKSYYKMTIELDEAGSAAFANVIPGQFAEFDLRNAAVGPKCSGCGAVVRAGKKVCARCRARGVI